MTTKNNYTGKAPLATDHDEFDEVLSKIESFEPEPICGRSEEALLRLLGRRDQVAIFNGAWRRFGGNPVDHLGRHLNGTTLLGAVHGGATVSTTKLVAWDIDSHVAGAKAEEVDVRGAASDLAGFIAKELHLPGPLFVSSKSGSGIHVYVLLSEDVGTREGHALGNLVKSRVGRREVDRVYPTASSTGLVLALPLCARRGGRPEWLKPGGSRVLDPRTLNPIDEGDEPEVILEWPSVTADHWQQAMTKVPVTQAKPGHRGPRHEADGKKRPERGDELIVLARDCEFIRHVADNANSITYDEWFSLATILKAFDNGRSFFHQLSSFDPRRYEPKTVDDTFDSVKGKPRYCTNLGWSCPKLGTCSALGVRSPAGLPYKLRGRRAA